MTSRIRLRAPHFAAALQLGPPSVARITKVLPGTFFRLWKTERSACAVGVPPDGAPAVVLSSVLVVGPSTPGGSPGLIGKTSFGKAHDAFSKAREAFNG